MRSRILFPGKDFSLSPKKEGQKGPKMMPKKLKMKYLQMSKMVIVVVLHGQIHNCQLFNF